MIMVQFTFQQWNLHEDYAGTYIIHAIQVNDKSKCVILPVSEVKCIQFNPGTKDSIEQLEETFLLDSYTPPHCSLADTLDKAQKTCVPQESESVRILRHIDCKCMVRHNYHSCKFSTMHHTCIDMEYVLYTILPGHLLVFYKCSHSLMQEMMPSTRDW